MKPTPHYPLRTSFRRLDRLVGELNVLLMTVAIGLAVLDLTILATLAISDEVRQQRRDHAVAAFVSVSPEPAAPRGAR